MSNEADNTVEKMNKYIRLFLLYIGISVLVITMGSVLFEKSGDNSNIYWIVIPILFNILGLIFIFKFLKLNRLIKNNKKFIKQLRDERAVENDYKSQARAYVTFLIVAGLYSFIASVQKVLFNNSYLFDISGFYVAIILLMTGILTYALSSYLIDK